MPPCRRHVGIGARRMLPAVIITTAAVMRVARHATRRRAVAVTFFISGRCRYHVAAPYLGADHAYYRLCYVYGVARRRQRMRCRGYARRVAMSYAMFDARHHLPALFYERLSRDGSAEARDGAARERVAHMLTPVKTPGFLRHAEYADDKSHA